MKVDKLQNYSVGSRNNGVYSQTPKQQSFTGMSEAEKTMMNMLHHKKAILKMKKLEWLKGEIGGILLTALGTGAIAPIFIGFNPFVKPKKDSTPEEKEELRNTKLYTAMRQPISAALAILFQASVQKYIDKGLDAIFNKPERAKYFRDNLDQSLLNTETYVKNMVKKEMKAKGIKKPSFFASLFGEKEIVDGEKINARQKYNIAVNDRVDEIREQQLQHIADEFERTNQIKIGNNRKLNDESLAKLVNEQIEKYQKDTMRMVKTPKQVATYVDKAETFINNEDRLRQMFADNPWEEIKRENDPKKLKDLYKKTTEMLQRNLDAETDPKVKKILNELLSLPEDLRSYKVQRTLDRIEFIKELCHNNFSTERYNSALNARNNVLQTIAARLELCKIEDPSKSNETIIGRTVDKIAEICKFKKDNSVQEAVMRNTDMFDTSKAKLKTKIYKDITKCYKELVKNNYKGWNQVSKILVGVFITLPITCTALNWVYPRFMELFFPKLSGAKKAQAQRQNSPQEQKVGGDK